MLYYALIKTIQNILKPLTSQPDLFRIFFLNMIFEDKMVREMASKSIKNEEELETPLSVFSKSFQEKLSQRLTRESENIVKPELGRIFSTDIGDLIKKGARTTRIELTIENKNLRFNYLITIQIEASSEKVVKTSCKLSFKKQFVEKRLRKYLLDLLKDYRERERKLTMESVLSLLIDEIRDSLDGLIGYNVYYFPASRAGILHSYRTVAKSIITQLPRLPLSEFEVPRMSGVVADFMGELISMRPREDIKVGKEVGEILEKAYRLFEDNILEGKINVEGTRPLPPEPVYVFNGFKSNLSRVSSMIAELASLVLLLKYGSLKKGDIVIIEEPEAHLHPDKQAKLVELFSILVNELGLNIIITTHSDIILNKVSNLIELSNLTNEEAQKLGFNKEYALKPTMVSVFLFNKTREGSEIKEIEVTNEGVSDEMFREVIKEIYDEHMKLYYKMVEKMSKKR